MICTPTLMHRMLWLSSSTFCYLLLSTVICKFNIRCGNLCLFVHLSVMIMSQTAKHIINLFLPIASFIILLYLPQIWWQNSNRAIKYRWFLTSIHLFLRIDSKHVHSSCETVIGSEVIYDLSTHFIAADLELSTTVTGNLFTVVISKKYSIYHLRCNL